MDPSSSTEIKDAVKKLSNNVAELIGEMKRFGDQLNRVSVTLGMQQYGSASFGGPYALQPSANNFQMPVNQPVYMQVPMSNLMYTNLSQQQMLAYQSSPVLLQSAQPIAQPSLAVNTVQSVQQPAEIVPNAQTVQQLEQVTQAAQTVQQFEQVVNNNNTPAGSAVNSSASELGHKNENQEKSITSTHKVKEEINDSSQHKSPTADEASQTSPSTSANASFSSFVKEQSQKAQPSSSNIDLNIVKSEEKDSDIEIIFEGQPRRFSTVGSKKHRVIERRCYFKNCSSNEFDVVFQSYNLWKEHLNTQHNGNSIICIALPECLESFKKREDLVQHISTHHSNMKKFTCTHCNSEFIEYSVYWSHYFSHHFSGQYQCSNCDFKAEHLNLIDRHFYEIHENSSIDNPSGSALKKLRT